MAAMREANLEGQNGEPQNHFDGPARLHGRAAAAHQRAARWAFTAALLALASCGSANHFSDGFLRLYAAPDPVLSDFFECHGFGCSIVSRVALTRAQWQEVRAEFDPPPVDARDERRRIAAAVALLERMVGAQTGTSAHQWTRHGGHIDGNPRLDPTQLDCIDESVNTWTYLTMFAHDGLLRYHRVEKLAYAGGLPDFGGAPRNVAVIQAIASGTYFAIDPTLVDAGEKPPIFSLAIFFQHWPPPALPKDDVD